MWNPKVWIIIALYEGGHKYFWNLNLPREPDVVQGSVTRYGEPTILWASLPFDIALRALCHFFWHFFLSVCQCVWRFFEKLKWLILKNRARARVCVCKILFPFEKNSSWNCHSDEGRLLRINPWLKHTCTSGLIVSKEMKCLLKTNRVVAALPRAELTKMLKKRTMLSLRIVPGPLMKYLK